MIAKGGNARPVVLHVATVNHSIRANLGYAPIETVIYNIDKGLTALGHRSIVACSGDSSVAGEQYTTVKHSIGDYCSDKTPAYLSIIDKHMSSAIFRAMMGDIDIIHMHDADAVERMYDHAFDLNIPIIKTLHVSAKAGLFHRAYQRWCKPLSQPLVYCAAISEYQKKQYGSLLYDSTVVHHGVAVDEFPVKDSPKKDSYLFTIGRITSDKGQNRAIEVARRTGAKLIIAGCVQNKAADRKFFASIKDSLDLVVEAGKVLPDKDYYDRVMKPLLDSDSQIVYIGELGSEHAKLWYHHARATLFPIQWGEPFGLVLIESMACGTPVIAFNKGSVPEIIVDGKTGFVVDTMDEMVGAVARVNEVDPRECRRRVETMFSITRMAGKYSALYQRAIREHESVVRMQPSLSKRILSAGISNAQIPEDTRCLKTSR